LFRQLVGQAGPSLIDVQVSRKYDSELIDSQSQLVLPGLRVLLYEPLLHESPDKAMDSRFGQTQGLAELRDPEAGRVVSEKANETQGPINRLNPFFPIHNGFLSQKETKTDA
jgi:hypothetical protein